MPFSFTTLPIDGLLVVEPRMFEDPRGFFIETYKATDFQANGIRERFVQDNHSCSSKGILRGLHFQRPPNGQAKIVRVVSGCVWDVAVDLRAKSPTYSKWHGVELSSENKKMLYIPEGFAHGFVALTDRAELIYKCSAEYNSASDGGVRWDDPDIGVQWPIREVIVSEKDARLPYLKDAAGIPL